MAQFEKLTAPSQGTPIRFENGQPVVADDPIIPFIRGDGTGTAIIRRLRASREKGS